MPRCSARTATVCWRAKWPRSFLALVVGTARGQGWASDEHFTVDGEFAGSLGRREEFSV